MRTFTGHGSGIAQLEMSESTCAPSFLVSARPANVFFLLSEDLPSELSHPAAHIASVSRDLAVMIWDRRTGRGIAVWGHVGRINAMRLRGRDYLIIGTQELRSSFTAMISLEAHIHR
jgi:hypothetical protein